MQRCSIDWYLLVHIIFAMYTLLSSMRELKHIKHMFPIYIHIYLQVLHDIPYIYLQIWWWSLMMCARISWVLYSHICGVYGVYSIVAVNEQKFTNNNYMTQSHIFHASAYRTFERIPILSARTVVWYYILMEKIYIRTFLTYYNDEKYSHYSWQIEF